MPVTHAAVIDDQLTNFVSACPDVVAFSISESSLFFYQKENFRCHISDAKAV